MQVILPGGSTLHGAEPGALYRGLLLVPCWGAHCDLIPWVSAASRKVVVRAGVKSQGPLCRAAELKRAGGLSWPPGPPVQRAPMVVCLLGASGMAVQWRAHQIVEASVAGQPE